MSALVAAGLALPPAATTRAEGGAACGVERWPVKTLSDPAADQVKFTPKQTTISALRSKPAPKVGTDTPRIKGVETTTYRVRAQLIGFVREDDKDIHLVVSVPGQAKKTMIVEFPDVTCPGARRSKKKAQMSAARTALVSTCGKDATTSFTKLSGRATLTGVGFFDIKHGQTGVAPNGIELHPVLSFKNSSCSVP